MDDLKFGRGSEYVDASSVILVFVSKGYFRSQNCMRELLRTVAMEKPIITLLESEANKGAMSRDEVFEILQAADSRFSQRWGDAFLAVEMAEWLEEQQKRSHTAAVSDTPEKTLTKRIPRNPEPFKL